MSGGGGLGLGVAVEEDILLRLEQGIKMGHVFVGHHHTSMTAMAGEGKDRFFGHRLVAVEDDGTIADVTVGEVEAVKTIADAVSSYVAFGNAGMAKAAEPGFGFVAEASCVATATLAFFTFAPAVGNWALKDFLLLVEVPNP